MRHQIRESRPSGKRRILLAMGLPSYERQRGIARYAREAGWILDARLLGSHLLDAKKEHIDSSRYHGALTLMSRLTPWLPALIRSLRIPVVDMWADFPDDVYPRVLLDHGSIGRMGAEYLLARGFRELLFYTHPNEGRAISRRENFRQAALRAGAHYHELICREWSHNARVLLLAQKVSGIPKPFGVMAQNDRVAAEVFEAAEQAHLRVPEDMAVLGVDNDPFVTELTEVPLSSIDSARERAGYESAALLDRLMNGHPPPANPLLVPPGRVISRRSTDTSAVRDPEVAKALHYIQTKFVQSITVDDVAERAVLSRRQLQDRFFAATGRTIKDAIMLRRIEHAKMLLTESPATIKSIARECGLRSGDRMSKTFRQWLGVSPQQFRSRHRVESQ